MSHFFLMEYCARSIVMAVQVMAGMWKRNGYSVVNQTINYQYHHSREIMYDKDILMLQVSKYSKLIFVSFMLPSSSGFLF